VVVYLLRGGGVPSPQERAVRLILAAGVFFASFAILLGLQDKAFMAYTGLPYDVLNPCVSLGKHSAETQQQIFEFWSVTDLSQLRCR
jgi:hypothetical protein